MLDLVTLGKSRHYEITGVSPLFRRINNDLPQIMTIRHNYQFAQRTPEMPRDGDMIKMTGESSRPANVREIESRGTRHTSLLHSRPRRNQNCMFIMSEGSGI